MTVSSELIWLIRYYSENGYYNTSYMSLYLMESHLNFIIKNIDQI